MVLILPYYDYTTTINVLKNDTTVSK